MNTLSQVKELVTVPEDRINGQWVSKPRYAHGVIRRAAYEQRKELGLPYVRILFGEAGRNGDPWGGLQIEINGCTYHFYAGVKRFPELYTADGQLNIDGVRALAHGIPGAMKFDETEWNWIQGEQDITGLLDRDAIIALETRFRAYQTGAIELPIFQSRIHSESLGVPVGGDSQNCTTIILSALNEHLPVAIAQKYPLEAFEEIATRVAGICDPESDAILARLLRVPESAFAEMFHGIDIKAVSKGTESLPPGFELEKIERRF